MSCSCVHDRNLENQYRWTLWTCCFAFVCRNQFRKYDGIVYQLSIEAKTGTLVGVSLGLCFFADLMISGIRAFMQQHIPFFNVISPASLIVDSFYALNMDLVSRYWENIASLLILSVVLLGISIWLSKGGKRK